MIRQKNDKFKRQEHRTFIDWFVLVSARITKSGHQTEIKMYENHFYKADWEELEEISPQGGMIERVTSNTVKIIMR